MTTSDGGATSPIRLLLADDHGVVRAGLRALLDAQPDMQVVAEAEDGPRAVELTRRYEPAVVVADLSM
ncbi:MAG TPA: response regulator transcription factor, partial [Thermomicrobiales bacterium]|nr:response regulator transcription factor [Thermomicrobiales bacterium]